MQVGNNVEKIKGNEKIMAGKLYGIGVGPGDPELITLKALRLTKEADILAFPGNDPRESVAYKIMKGAYPQIEEKELLSLPMPMTKEKEELKRMHDKGAELIAHCLEKGKCVAFLTLGDPTVYSTYLYVHKRIKKMGYDTEIINGIPSFCAVSARLDEGLVEKAQQLHVIPASYQITEALKLPGTKVLMKAGKKMKEVKGQIKELGYEAVMIENCGMAEEHIYRSQEEIPEDAGYYSLIIVKEKN